MDKFNRFHTPATYALVRLDWALIGAVSLVLLIVHHAEVRWSHFTVAFLFPDVISVLPGLYFYYGRRNGARRSIPGIIHKLYNFGHSFATAAAICAVWWIAGGGFAWAMLALPIHLCGDRSLFGNTYKPLGLSFEPVKHDAWTRFERDYEAAGIW
jgi:hypothetical protein